MNKSIVFGIVTTFAVLAIIGGVAFANFSSSVSNNANTFGSGTLVLKVNDQAPTSTAVFTLPNEVPGFTATQVLDLKNTGSVGAATTVLTGITVTPHAVGDLGDVLTLSLVKDTDNDGVVDGGEPVILSAHLTTGGSSSAWTNLPLGFALPSLGSQKVLATITFDSGAGDAYQGKSVSFDFSFIANQ
jgi:hypothetical protein